MQVLLSNSELTNGNYTRIETENTYTNSWTGKKISNSLKISGTFRNQNINITSSLSITNSNINIQEGTIFLICNLSSSLTWSYNKTDNLNIKINISKN